MKNTIIIGVLALVVMSLGTWSWKKFNPSKQSSEVQAQAVEQVYYTCPMHPSVRTDRPGDCPVCGMALVEKSAQTGVSNRKAEKAEEYYTCPMHESVHSDRPGACPVCGMTLVKKSVQEDMEEGNLSKLQAVSLSPTQRVMANVTTAKVRRKTVSKEIQAVGIVSYAEPNYRLISMRFPGRVEKLYITYTGQTVHKGDPVAEVYSPEAITAEQKYLLSLESYQQTTASGAAYAGPVAQILEQAKEKLIQWGFTEKQIANLNEADTLGSIVTIYSPVSGTVVKKSVDPQRYLEAGDALFDVADLSTVWILLDVYEKDIRFVHPGQPVQITTEAYPLDKFIGRVVFIDPVLTPETRTIRVRTEFPNPEGKLKPNMYVSAAIAVPQSNALVVPNTAILSMGKRSVVWVEVKENTFEPRRVVVGTTSDDFTVILDGLAETETVAATGAFLIDAESALTWTGADDLNNQ